MKTQNFLAVLTIGLGLLVTTNRQATAQDEIPGDVQKQPIALIGGAIHTVSDGTIAKGTILFEKGVIVAIGENVMLPKGTHRIDVTGKHVYPGLIEPSSNIGLTEVDSTNSTVDSTEIGSLNPNVRTLVAVNPDSTHIPVGRGSGVLLSGSVPSGNLVAGQSSLIQLDGWTWEDMSLKGQLGMHISWPTMSPV
ncbi:MAG: imidazolonepropionase, partial [Pirellulaceae bacterium]|nr:imidazolonepropionase [Pirellulaceae bacterium]